MFSIRSCCEVIHDIRGSSSKWNISIILFAQTQNQLLVDLSDHYSLQDLLRGHCPSCSSDDMRRLPVASLFICFWLVDRNHCNSSLQDSMGELHSRFAISLYQTLTKMENNSNLIVSPVSISLTLGLLQLGARGSTLSQIEGTLGYNVNGRICLSFYIQYKRDPRFCSSTTADWTVVSSTSGWKRKLGWRLLLMLWVWGCWRHSVLLVPGGVERCCCCTVVSGAIIPASTPTLISLITAARPLGREVIVFNYKQNERNICYDWEMRDYMISHISLGWKLILSSLAEYLGCSLKMISISFKESHGVNYRPQSNCFWNPHRSRYCFSYKVMFLESSCTVVMHWCIGRTPSFGRNYTAMWLLESST